MLEAIRIQNYKSIHDLRLNLGRLNVFIGENGCGKSNILEAIALSAAAESRKLDNEFLSSRGVRVTQPDLMRSNFKTKDYLKTITTTLSFSDIEEDKTYILNNDNKAYSKWEANYDPNINNSDIINIISNMRKYKSEGNSANYFSEIEDFLYTIDSSKDFITLPAIYRISTISSPVFSISKASLSVFVRVILRLT
jgi:AAA15 family ATPase/GTPase